MVEQEIKNERPVFKTIEKFEKTYGTRNFIEVALKETEGVGGNTFFSISKGFITQNNMRKYKNSLGFSANEDIHTFLVDSLNKLIKKYKELPKKESAPAEKKEEKVEKKEDKKKK
ncbi:Uncharacterised protein [Candidatus Tiddalikarchaeum anstoanum]|nr:Uncharacterised protein [Candidatus Tiddalikarchaeum anstoanum]